MTLNAREGSSSGITYLHSNKEMGDGRLKRSFQSPQGFRFASAGFASRTGVNQSVFSDVCLASGAIRFSSLPLSVSAGIGVDWTINQGRR